METPASLSYLIETLGMKVLRSLCQVPMNPDGGPAAWAWIVLVFTLTAIICVTLGIIQGLAQAASAWRQERAW
jgi:hypothetical protein